MHAGPIFAEANRFEVVDALALPQSSRIFRSSCCSSAEYYCDRPADCFRGGVSKDALSAGFQLWMTPFKSLETIASSEDSTMAAI